MLQFNFFPLILGLIRDSQFMRIPLTLHPPPFRSFSDFVFLCFEGVLRGNVPTVLRPIIILAIDQSQKRNKDIKRLHKPRNGLERHGNEVIAHKKIRKKSITLYSIQLFDAGTKLTSWFFVFFVLGFFFCYTTNKFT